MKVTMERSGQDGDNQLEVEREDDCMEEYTCHYQN